VAYFLTRSYLRADLIELLKGAGDIGRIVQRFALKRGDVSDLLTVKKTIDIWNLVSKRIASERKHDPNTFPLGDGWGHIDQLRKRLIKLDNLSKRIDDAVEDTRDLSIEEERDKDVVEGSFPLPEGAFKWTIKPG